MVELTQELIKKHLKYENGFLYWIDFSIRPTAKETAIGYLSKRGYVSFKFFNKTTYVHRVIFIYHHGYLPKEIDHINGNKADNRIENLREATHSQNMTNVKKYTSNTSGYKGVYFHKPREKWYARIKFNKKFIHLGVFDCPKKAYEEYCRAAIEYHGEYAHFG